MRVRLEKRDNSPVWLNIMLTLSAILATLVLCGGLIALAGANVIHAYTVLFASALNTTFNLVETIVKAAPLVLTGLAVTVAFRAKYWNIGAEGQFLLGAMAAVFVGTQPWLPAWTLVPLMILAGAVAGAALAAFPAFAKVRFKVDDVVTTLLLNFIVFFGMMALLEGPWKDPLSGYPDSPDIRTEAEFPVLLRGTRLHLGVVVAALATIGVWSLMRFTTLGFAIRAVGENPRAAAFAGHSIVKVVIITGLISGALAGLAGAGEAGALHFQVMAGISTGYGYTGIVIAMLARLSPIGVVPAALFFAVIITGAEAMSRATGVPVFLADVIQGTALMTMLIALLFTEYRLRVSSTRHG
jgi:general nucleoside transport system permease protein